MRDYIILNNNDSRQLQGLIISTLPPISMPKQRVILEEIDGRDGDIITDLGYSAYDKEFEIGLSFNYNVDDIIKYFSDNKKGKAIFSNELDKYYKYEIYEQIDFNKLIRFKTATVKMHVQPFKYESDEEKIEINATEVTGEGSNITLNNTENGARFLDMKYKGNITQTTYSGKNLFPRITFSQTINGVTITASEGIIKIKGTATGSGVNHPIWGAWASSTTLFTLPSGTYTASGIGTRQSSPRINIVTNGTTSIFVTNTTQTLETDTNVTGIFIWVDAGTTVDTTFKYQIEKGSTATDYEPYVGGSASPNPSYPQNIEIVTGNTNVKISNKNRLKFETAKTNVVAGVTMTCDNNTTFTMNGTKTSGVQLASAFNLQPTKLVGQYKFTGYTRQDTYVQLYWKDKNGTIKYSVLNSNPTITFNEGDYLFQIFIYIGANVSSTFDNETFNFQLEKGNTITSYVAHQEQNYEIDLPVENLFDGQLEVGNISWGADISDNNICRSINYIEVKEKTDYIFSIDGIAHRVMVSMYDKDKNFIANSGENGKATTTGTFTTYTGTKYLRFRCYDGDKSLFENGNLQLELGTKANAYTPYGTTPIELCKIENYQDYIYKNNSNWFFHEEIEKLLLTSSMPASLTESSSYGPICYLNVGANYYNNTTNIINIISSKFVGVSYDDRTTLTNGYRIFTSNTGQITLRFPVGSSISSVLDVQNFLTENNIYVYAVLKTPKETQITDENLIAQLEELWNATTYEEQTNILTSGDLEPIIYVKTYGMDNPSYTIRNNGNTYSKPYITLYGLGVVGVYLNGYQIFNIDFGDSNSTQKINIDTENMEATNDNGLANRLVVGDYSNFKLNVGDNILSFTGTIQGFQISNYSRWL